MDINAILRTAQMNILTNGLWMSRCTDRQAGTQTERKIWQSHRQAERQMARQLNRLIDG